MSDEVLFSCEGQVGIITLNRAGSLNALTLTMILQLQKQLLLWKEDNTVKAVVIRASPGKAFCAGGDVRWLYNSGRANDVEQMQFFWHEYRLNYFIHHFGKPYISLMDGITMGGGVGVSLHGSYPIASERFVFAMPETSIGFFPDIGASYLLNRCPGSLGLYLGLTGNRLGPQDALRAGLVHQVVHSEQMPEMLDALVREDLSVDAHLCVDRCLQAYAMKGDSTDASHINSNIDSCFAQPGVELIRKSLQNSDTAWAMDVDHILEQKSPLSLKVTFTQLQKSRHMSLADCLKMDYGLVAHFVKDSDFYEGVRALLIDKDKNPHWRPSRLDLVTENMVDNYFGHTGSSLEFLL